MENSRQESQKFIISNETQLLRYLDQHGISYRRVRHPAVFTCEEAELYRPTDDDILSAASTKNLFLCDKKGRNFYLVVTGCEKHLNLANLAIKLSERKLRFASEQKLLRYLGITRGAVTMLALINDQHKQVQLCIDSQIWRSMTFLCHPLVNTATLIISKSDLQRFLQLSGHEINLIEM